MARRRTASAAPPSFTSLPPELLLAVAAKLDQLDRMHLVSTCTALRALDRESPEALWEEVVVDIEALLEAAFDRDRASAQQHSCRSWLMRRRAAISSLEVRFATSESLEGNLCILPVVCALVASLAEAGLRRLRYLCNCEVPFLDALVPWGAPALGCLAVEDAHLAALPPVVATLSGLTRLELGVCQGFSEHMGGVEGLDGLRHLTALQSLTLHHALYDAVPAAVGCLTRLTALNLANNELVEPSLPNACSALTGLLLLDLSNCAGLGEVPEVVQHFTRLRTLLLASCDLGSHFADEGAGGAPPQELHPQGVPLALAALRSLQELSLANAIHVHEMPQAWLGLTGLTKLSLGGGLRTLPPGRYLSSLQDLSITYTWHLSPDVLTTTLGAATALRRLSLRHSRVNNAPLHEVPPAVCCLSCLTFLDLGFTGACRFPTGPYAARLEELHVDRCAPNSAAPMQRLPALPCLRRLNWQGNLRLGVAPVRRLLQQAPRLQVLWMERGAATAPAHKALAAAEVEVAPHNWPLLG